jgi:phosphomannomutase
MKCTVSEWMTRSGVKFGTSGARGLAVEMTDRVCHAYTTGFLQYLRRRGELRGDRTAVVVGGDRRPSTDRIMAAVFRAVTDAGCTVVNAGKVPSPAVALAGLERGIPAIMVTGSHIPDDRNGIKFNKPSGEILKDDEAGMMAEVVDSDDAAFGADGSLLGVLAGVGLPGVEDAVRTAYVARYLGAFPSDALRGMRLGVYQHSAVGRDVIVEILRGLGAEVTSLGRSERFIPVDTEAVRPEDIDLARDWAAGGQYDALMSADGDSDRPLVSDERGEWLRGDVAGILCARFLAADSVTTPVSSNTAVEACGWFGEVRRTRIGSPYVVASMLAASAAGRRRVVGYEANGGFLIDSDLELGSGLGRLRALPTRDALIVMLGVLLLARKEGRSVRELVDTLPARFTASDRLQAFPAEASRRILARFGDADEVVNRRALGPASGGWSGRGHRRSTAPTGCG